METTYNNTAELEVTLIKYTDIRDKEQMYISIENFIGEKCLINIGQKNYELLKTIIEKQTTINLNNIN